MKNCVTPYQYGSGYMYNVYNLLIQHPPCKFKSHSLHEQHSEVFRYGTQLRTMKTYFKVDGS